jgi:DNA-binding GntR family transcriptional regulator
MPTTSSTAIADRLVEAILARRVAPGTRLGEQPLSALFGVSRTIVREALMRLAARGIVTVSARRGWYVIEPSVDEAGEAFAARRVIELGLIRSLDRIDQAALRRLKAHVNREKAALRASDVGTRSFLLGDFHVCLAECLGSGLLAEILRDLTARTTLIAMLYQPQDKAVHSCAEHAAIVAALERGDRTAAERLMAEHLEHVATGIDAAVPRDPLANLRSALAPVLNVRVDEPAPRLHDRSLVRSNRRRAATGGRRART